LETGVPIDGVNESEIVEIAASDISFGDDWGSLAIIDERRGRRGACDGGRGGRTLALKNFVEARRAHLLAQPEVKNAKGSDTTFR
jgi:hypothetical protein